MMLRLKSIHLTLAVLLGIALAAALPAVAMAGTWPNSTSPTYAGPGSEPINESKCLSFDVCAFLTANGDSFQVVLPRGFIAKFADGTQVDAMDVIAAMLKLPATQYAPANVSGVGGSISVAPSYTTKLATVGVTPDMLLGWLEANVQPSQKAPWIPGSANNPAPATPKPTTKPVSTAKLVVAQQPAAVYPTTPKASQVPAAQIPSGTSKTPVTKRKTGSAAGTKAAGTSAPLPPGSVVPNAPACPSGESQVVKPNGSICMPDAPLNVKPPAVPQPWWQAHERALVIGLAVLLAAALAVVLWRRARDPYRAYR